jgi:hypothetical protein
MKIQKKLFAFLALNLFAAMTWGQNVNDENKSSSSFFEISGGIGVNTPMQFTQIGTAHKRGDFNEFDTDFDLNVLVNGECKAVTNYGINISANQLRQNQKGKWNFGGGINFSYNQSKILVELANESHEIVSNINGPNGVEVIDFVNEHYSALHHIFENEMDLSFYSTTAKIILQRSLSERTSIQTSLGAGISVLQAKNAISRQLSPSSTPPGFETSIDEDGGAVNHFNGKNNAAGFANILNWEIGISQKIKNNLSLIAKGIATRTGNSNFTFGSTQYSDHPPTDHWSLNLDSYFNFNLSIGLQFKM